MELTGSAKLIMDAAGRQGPLCLLYHSIELTDGVPSWRWAVSLRAFESQLDLLQQYGYRTVLGSDLIAPASLPEKTVCITFDDGYRDNLVAVEALARRGMCATFFMVAGDIGGHASWFSAGTPVRAMLDADQLREMEHVGMEVGSHTMRHRKLTTESDETVLAELTMSRDRLSDVLGRDVTIFAYPHGAHDPRVVNLVARAGYRLASTTIARFVADDEHPLTIPRTNVMSTDSLSWFARKIAFGGDDVSWRRVAPRLPLLLWRRLGKWHTASESASHLKPQCR